MQSLTAEKTRKQIKSCPAENLGIVVDEKLDTSWQGVLAAQTANCILGCIKSSMSSRVREVILPPTWSPGSLSQKQTWT